MSNRNRRKRRGHLPMVLNAAGAPTDVILACEPVTWVAAAEGDVESLKRFTILAYTGVAMGIGPYRIVVDLSGMSVTEKPRPILKDHDPAQIVGHTSAVNVGRDSITLDGVVSGSGAAAAEVVATSARGFPWQASIGACVGRYEKVAPNQTVTVNGKSFDGPLYVARESRLAEVSFVALGADDQTEAKVAAKAPAQPKEQDMGFDAWLKAHGLDRASLDESQITALQAAYDAEQTMNDGQGGTPPKVTASGTYADVIAAARREQERQDKIAALVAEALTDYPGTADIDALEAIAREAIEGKWTLGQTELAILRATRPRVNVSGRGRSEKAPNAEVIEAGLALSAGLTEPEKHYSEQVLSAAERRWRRGLTLGETLLLMAANNGHPQRSIRDVQSVLEAAFPPREARAAGFSTVSLPGILSNVANKFMVAGFEAVEQVWRLIAAIRAVSDFKAITSYRMTGGFEFEEVGPDGELKHGKVGEESYTNQAKTHGRMFAITRQMIINDDMDALSAIPRRIGRGGALKLNKVFWGAFLNNSTFFTDARANYAEGATTALNIAALTTADKLFRAMKDADGTPIGIEPKILLTPSSLRVDALTLMNSAELRHDTDADGDAAIYPTINPHRGAFKPVSSAYLQSGALTGYSALAWYLLADPADLAVIEVVFLNGQQTPTVESADADFNVLGIQFRGFFDFGVSLQDYRGGVKMKGEA